MDFVFGSTEHEGLSVSGWDVVDAVSAGADPTGASDSGPAINSALGDDTLLVFPSGRYLIDTPISIQGASKAGLYSPDRAILEPGPSIGEGAKTVAAGNVTPNGRLLVENIEVDISNNNTASAFLLDATNQLYVSDVAVTGQAGETTANPSLVSLGLVDGGGLGYIEGLSLPDGSVWPSTGNRQHSANGVFVRSANRGTIIFDGCHVEGFSDNGLRATDGNGHVEVRGGLYKNNNFANIRPSNRHRIVGARLVVDAPNPAFPAVRPLYLAGHPTVSDCTIEYLSDGGASELLTVTAACSGAEIRNVHIQVDHSARAINVSGLNIGVDAGRVTITNPTIVGAADGSVQTDTIRSARGGGGNGVTVINPHIDQPGAGRNGIIGVNAVIGGEVTVNNHTILATDNATISNVESLQSATRPQLVTTTGADISLNGLPATVTNVKAGTRTRWNGVLGGGPLGGYNIGTLTGANPGDIARATGTTGSADALYILKSSGVWQALHDPATTITPA